LTIRNLCILLICSALRTGDEFIDRVSGGGYWPGSLMGIPRRSKGR
jgi:hypothetical protein